jgi:hypothetical protein
MEIRDRSIVLLNTNMSAGIASAIWQGDIQKLPSPSEFFVLVAPNLSIVPRVAYQTTPRVYREVDNGKGLRTLLGVPNCYETIH